MDNLTQSLTISSEPLSVPLNEDREIKTNEQKDEKDEFEIIENFRKKTTTDKKSRSGSKNIIMRAAASFLCCVTLASYGIGTVSKLRVFFENGAEQLILSQIVKNADDSESVKYDVMQFPQINISNSPLSLILNDIRRYSEKINSPNASEIPETEISEQSPETSVPESQPEPLPEDFHKIIVADLSSSAPMGLDTFNETDYNPDLYAIAENPPQLEAPEELYSVYGENAPIVLIIHTHGTEAYSDENQSSYHESDNPRSDDITKNVVAVGAVMSEILNERGINTIHCEIMHDKESYVDSYTRAAETIKQYIAEYPSIRYVFDVHRDSIIGSDKTKYRPVANIDGEFYAQFMSVVGTDFKGANHPNWIKNLELAVAIQTKMNAYNSTLTRSINLRGAAFNEQYTSGSLLLEIGSCGNSLEEAKRTAKITAETIADIICGTENKQS